MLTTSNNFELIRTAKVNHETWLCCFTIFRVVRRQEAEADDHSRSAVHRALTKALLTDAHVVRHHALHMLLEEWQRRLRLEPHVVHLRERDVDVVRVHVCRKGKERKTNHESASVPTRLALSS